MKKLVNGVSVEMTKDEESAWTASLPKSEPPVKQKTDVQLLTEKLISKGILTEADASELRAKK